MIVANVVNEKLARRFAGWQRSSAYFVTTIPFSISQETASHTASIER